MKILILGASGRTGKLLVKEALRRGHLLHALVRNPEKMKGYGADLTLFTGTPYRLEDIPLAMKGCEAVLSVLNLSRKSDFPWAPLISPKDFLSVSIRHVVQSMQQEGLTRLIVVSAWGVGDSRKEIPGWFRWFIEHSHIQYPYQDHAVQETILQSSTLQWTIVRPAGLTNSLKHQEIQVSFQGQPPPTLTISRSNVANFLLDTLENNAYIREIPTISKKA